MPADNPTGVRAWLAPASPPPSGGGETVKRALQAARSHLGMEVAYVSEFVDDRSVFREVDAPGLEHLAKVGDSHALDDVYCRHILEGRLPELIPDTAHEPVAAAMPITHALPVGAHVSVPIRLPDGRTYGMFCCLSPHADSSLNQRDLQVLKAFADIAAFEIGRDLEGKRAVEEKAARIRQVVEEDRLSILFQPIWHVETGRPVGLESLARISIEPYRPPDQWFAEAAEAGLGEWFELAAMRKAATACQELPPEVYLAINVSPGTVLSDRFASAMRGMPVEQIVLEITEHAPVADYRQLLEALRPLRDRGLRIAVDDAGAGYSSLQHILHLQPDLIKLDMGLTRDIDTDRARRALAAALIGFARDTNCRIIAEGVETASELETLRGLGVQKAQGYFLGRPAPLREALRLIQGTLPTGKRAA